jgi:hypothetical protein
MPGEVAGRRGWRVYRYRYGIPRQLKRVLKRLFEGMGLHVVAYWDRDVEVDRERRERYVYYYETIEAFGEVGRVSRATVCVLCTGHGDSVSCRVYRVSDTEEVELRSGDDVGGLREAIDRVSAGG